MELLFIVGRLQSAFSKTVHLSFPKGNMLLRQYFNIATQPSLGAIGNTGFASSRAFRPRRKRPPV